VADSCECGDELLGSVATELVICWWIDNVKIDLKYIVYECVEWIHLAEINYQWWTREHYNKPLHSIKVGEFLE
jgi:hypothetical protein